MERVNTCTFKVRPGYGSKVEMIEVWGIEPKLFLEKLKPVLLDINATKASVTDLWVNDEIILQFGSDIGSFNVSFGHYGDIFIMSGEVFDKTSRSNIVVHKLAAAMISHDFEQRPLSPAELRKYKSIKSEQKPQSYKALGWAALGGVLALGGTWVWAYLGV